MARSSVMLPLLCIALLLCISNAAEPKVGADGVVHYHGHKVVRALVDSQKQADLIEMRELDVWSRHGVIVVGKENDIMLTHDDLQTVGLDNYTVLIHDVERHLSTRDAPTEQATFFDQYHSYEEVVQYITDLAHKYPNLTTLVPSIGTSIEGRAIPAIEITGGKSPSKNLFISGGQHAREWIAHATVLYIVNALLTQYGTDPHITALVDKYNIYVVPLVNPDGYTYTRTTNRLWRKNRRQNANGSYGVDLNRNWDEHWCEYGSSRSFSSEVYCGSAPFSEPESKATSEYILKHSHSAFIDFHSYGQLVLRPYGWTTALPPSSPLLISVGDGIAQAIYNVHRKVYESESGADLYPASGAADDWSYAKAGIPLVYTIELRDSGMYGFQLPANQIIPTGEEALAAFKYLSTRVQ